jgi:hypothetical protein
VTRNVTRRQIDAVRGRRPVIYVNRIEDARLDEVVQRGSYLKARQDVLHKHGGLWCNGETFVVSRRHQ